MYKLYGIANCDTVKKVRTFLNESNIEYDFVDFKKSAPTQDWILNWRDQLGDWPVNPRGRTFKMIKDQFEGSASDEQKVQLLIENSSAIKRPLLEKNGKVVVVGNDQKALKSL
jgi:Spx/MgsR family transcriptional regulator